jgi:peptidylprolyl isomerase/peptidyl-prolyl cis-trans isomerase B (cyclophilin B)
MHRISLLVLIAVFISACSSNEENTEGKIEKQEVKKLSPEELAKVDMVLIETEFGNMKVRLYDETPKHKSNFLKLANDGFFNDVLFHRVINQFMIQGGDPDSRNAAPGVMLGNGGPGYDIDAEFNDSLFHVKGTIAAAREGDDINPMKMSSGSQFYLVQGNKWTDEDLDDLEIKISSNEYLKSHPAIMEELMKYQEAEDMKNYNKLFESLPKKKDFKRIRIPDFKRKAYKTIGGVPHLDNNYTVFGEVVEGIEVIDKIAAVETDGRDRPKKDVKMTIKPLVK